MMNIDRLLELLTLWKYYMLNDKNTLGYPSRSIGLSSGGESSYNAFDEMYETSENQNVKIIDAVIDSLDKEQRKAIYARYLGTKKPEYYELKLEMAIDNLLTIAGRRIYA